MHKKWPFSNWSFAFEDNSFNLVKLIQWHYPQDIKLEQLEELLKKCQKTDSDVLNRIYETSICQGDDVIKIQITPLQFIVNECYSYDKNVYLLTKLLINYGANPLQRQDDDIESPLSAAIKTSKNHLMVSQMVESVKDHKDWPKLVDYLGIEALKEHVTYLSTFRQKNSLTIIELLLQNGCNLFTPLKELEEQQSDFIGWLKRGLGVNQQPEAELLFNQLKLQDCLILSALPKINQHNVETILNLRQDFAQDYQQQVAWTEKLSAHLNYFTNLAHLMRIVEPVEIHSEASMVAEYSLKSVLLREENLQISNKLSIAYQQLYELHQKILVADELDLYQRKLEDTIDKLPYRLNPSPLQDFYYFVKENRFCDQLNLISSEETKNIFDILHIQEGSQNFVCYSSVHEEWQAKFCTGNGGKIEDLTSPYIQSLYQAFRCAYQVYLRQEKLTKVEEVTIFEPPELLTELEQSFFDFFSTIAVKDIDSTMFNNTYLTGVADEILELEQSGEFMY